MNPLLVQGQKLRNLLHSTVLLGAMAVLLAWLGSLVFGGPGPVVVAAAIVLLGGLGTGLAPEWAMRFHRARPLAYSEAPRLYEIIGELARRAGLDARPRLYHVASAQPNAFAVGGEGSAAIAVTDGLLRRMDTRELTGVLAHEVSHVKNGDLKIMAIAGMMDRMTRTLAFFGRVLAFVSLPLAIVGSPLLPWTTIPWTTILLLLFAPTLATLLFQALSRTREYEADLEAARLTGDPEGLARALTNLERPLGFWERLFFPNRRRQAGPLSTHPATEERVRRLRSLYDRPVTRPPLRPPVRRPQPMWARQPVQVRPPARVPRPTRMVFVRDPGHLFHAA